LKSIKSLFFKIIALKIKRIKMKWSFVLAKTRVFKSSKILDCNMENFAGESFGEKI
jgi:hypothetical protein